MQIYEEMQSKAIGNQDLIGFVFLQPILKIIAFIAEILLNVGSVKTFLQNVDFQLTLN